MSRAIAETLRGHLFQSDLEQAAFLFTTAGITQTAISLVANDLYLVPPEGWAVQHELYLEMDDDERARIMRMARDRGAGVVDCHSHRGSGRRTRFSPSDLARLPHFAAYAKWKLDGKPFAALVWGEDSVDGRVWFNDFSVMHHLDEVVIDGVRSFSIPAPLPSRASNRSQRRA
jgi:hypothetical protein